MVLPAPVPPTMPTVVRAGMLSESPRSAVALGERVGIVHVDELEPLAAGGTGCRAPASAAAAVAGRRISAMSLCSASSAGRLKRIAVISW